jgi:hypothetical protein
MIDADIEEEIGFEVPPGEKLRWTGRPRKGLIFKRSDIFYIPFSLIWLGFAITFFVLEYRENPWSFFTLYIGLFVAYGLYFVAGRFFYESKRREKMMYGITDTKVIIKSGVFNTAYDTLDIKDQPDIVMVEEANGYGTIIFGSNKFKFSDLPGMGKFNNQPPPTRLEYINDVVIVYVMLTKIQNTLQ